ncbi:MAG: hypothetical protein WC994_10955 [Brumimicrobium sp.]
MRKNLQFMFAVFFMFVASNAFAQTKKDLNCFEIYEKAFKERGSFQISDNMYRNVMLSFFEGDEVYCVRGKVRVENGYISSIFYYYDDNTEELYEKNFHNTEGKSVRVFNGISELIINADREKLRVVFIDQLRPKKKQRQVMEIPDDL